MSIEIPEVVRLPADRLVVAPWNPNEMSPKKFKGLVDHIKESGFLQPLLAWPMDEETVEDYVEDPDDGQYWLIIDGAHRYDAGRTLAMDEFPVIERPSFDEDMVKFRNMSMNMLKGSISTEKFTALYTDLSERYPDEVLEAQMGLVEQGEMKRLVKEVSDTLPDDMKKELGEKTKDIDDVDDLSRVVEEMMTAHGSDLAHDFMVFSHGGQSHLMVQMDARMKATIDEVKAFCRTQAVSINAVLAHLLGDTASRLESFEEPEPVDVS